MATKRVQKNLTVMFTDISGFTKHTETISREALMARLDTHNELLMPIVAHFDGKIVKTIGDAFLITFESPTNAVHCGLFIQHTLRKFNVDKPEDDQIHIKISIHGGEVTVTENDVFGDPVNVAAKIEKATNPDEIYFTESVFLAMNKAEVPTSFVKTFRPKGAESTEIKLYRVAMDEDDQRYKDVVANTHIDKERVKTRVLELSNLAEREFTRYQDALDQIVARQDQRSRGVVIAVVASALLVAGAVIFAMNTGGGTGGTNAEDTLAKDVRAYLQMERPADARTRIQTYLADEGADDTTETLFAEVRSHELNALASLATAMIASGKPQDAIVKIDLASVTPTDMPKALARAKAQAAAYVQARQRIAEGAGAEAAATLTDAFGDTNPSTELRQLREQAQALLTVQSMMSDARRYNEPLLILGEVSAAFGDDTKNKSALRAIQEALANELFRAAKARGPDAAAQDYEMYRKRFTRMPTWGWIEAQLAMGTLWHARTGTTRRTWSHSDKYWKPWRAVREYVKDKPEHAYRFGCCLYLLARATGQGTCDGALYWLQALATDPTLQARHAELGTCYRPTLAGAKARLGKDLKTDVSYMLGCFTGGLKAMRALVDKYFYDELREQLVRFADSDDKDLETEQMNAIALLATRDDVEQMANPAAAFQAQFDTFVTGGDRLSRAHSKALFGAPMRYADYEDLRRLIDKPLADAINKQGRFASHTGAQAVLEAMANDLADAQPTHTAAYDGR